MTGDPHESRSDWLQRARLEFRSNAIIFHDETFVKMITVEDILNRLSEERQRCYKAHSDAEMRQQDTPSLDDFWKGCGDLRSNEAGDALCAMYGECCFPNCSQSGLNAHNLPKALIEHNRAIDQAAREDARKEIIEDIAQWIQKHTWGANSGLVRALVYIDVVSKEPLLTFLRNLRSTTPPTDNQIKPTNNNGIPNCCGVNCPDLSQGCKDHCPNGYDHEKATVSESGKTGDPK